MFVSIFNTLVKYMYILIKYSSSYFNKTTTNLFETRFHQPIKHPFRNEEIKHLGWLSSITPCFGIHAKKIRIICKPEIFYETLLRKISEAKRRITIASLYLGTGKLEENIVNEIKNNKNFSNGDLKLNILLDYQRGSRFKINSRTMLQPLFVINDKNCNINFYHSPCFRGLKKKLSPERFREIFGLQHMKLYIFDNDVIISGANLCHDYFTNRQDRYFDIEDNYLADFYVGLVEEVQQFSFKMDRNNKLEMRKNWRHSFEGDFQDFVHKANNSIINYVLKSKNKQNIDDLQSYDTWIYPLLQMKQIGIEQDSLVTEHLLEHAPKDSKLFIATGYFNLTMDYIRTIIKKSVANYKILTAHPEANGFHGAKGLAGGIPMAFSLLLNRFYNAANDEEQTKRINLYEFLRKDWTYHAKGLWYYPVDCDKPCLTLIGSPNFGERSVKLDLETQLAIVTENENLRNRLHEEREYLYEQGQNAVIDRKIPMWIYFALVIFQKYF